MTDILILSVGTDYANLGFLYSKSLMSVGVDSISLIDHHERIEYPKQGVICKSKSKRMRKYVKKAKIIQFMHSLYFDIKSIKNKRIFVVHGGTRYRQNPKKFNKIFNPIVEKTIIQTGDLLGLGSKNEVWILPPVDTENIKPIYNNINEEKIIIAHYPSKAKVKRSDIINTVMEKINKDPYNRNKIRYIYSPKWIFNWKDNLKRMSKCDIYIEMLALKQGNKRYGEWGVTALEAAALGKVVVTNFLSLKRYEKEYGKCPLMVVNNDEELKNVLQKLISMNKTELLKIKKETRKWAENLHSYKAVGKRLKEKVYEI